MFRDLVDDLRSNGGVELEVDRELLVTLIVLPLLLTAFYYWGRPPFYREELAPFFKDFVATLDKPLRGLAPYYYWAISSVVLRMLIPALLIVVVFRRRLSEYGYRRWERGHALPYLGLYLALLPALIAVSFTAPFQAKYPIYGPSADSIEALVLFQLAYGLQFIALEAFFRGFLVFALFRRLGYLGVVIMTVPYCMVHFGKPAAESFGAIVAGLVLGVLAIRGKSWVPGAILHWCVGLTMDLLCLWQR